MRKIIIIPWQVLDCVPIMCPAVTSVSLTGCLRGSDYSQGDRGGTPAAPAVTAGPSGRCLHPTALCHCPVLPPDLKPFSWTHSSHGRAAWWWLLPHEEARRTSPSAVPARAPSLPQGHCSNCALCPPTAISKNRPRFHAIQGVP